MKDELQVYKDKEAEVRNAEITSMVEAAIAAGKLVEVTDTTTTVNGVAYHTVAESSGDLGDAAVIGTALTAAAAAGDLLTIAIK